MENEVKEKKVPIISIVSVLALERTEEGKPRAIKEVMGEINSDTMNEVGEFIKEHIGDSTRFTVWAERATKDQLKTYQEAKK